MPWTEILPPMNYDMLVSHAETTGGPPPMGEEIVYGGVHIRKFVIPAKSILISHCHVYDHFSILASGEVELWTPSGLRHLIGPAEVKIEAGVKHALNTITDITWYCIHAGEPEFEGSK